MMPSPPRMAYVSIADVVKMRIRELELALVTPDNVAKWPLEDVDAAINYIAVKKPPQWENYLEIVYRERLNRTPPICIIP